MPESKICKKCRAEKPVSEFRMRSYGGAPIHIWACKFCEREDKRAWNKANPDKISVQKKRYRAKYLDRIRAYDRKRDLEPTRYAKIIETARARAATPEGKEWRKRYTKWYRIEQKEKYKAQTALGNALRTGKITKGPCASCGTSAGRIIGHHHDYSKPLDVIWLCPACHGAEHRALRWGVGDDEAARR